MVDTFADVHRVYVNGKFVNPADAVVSPFDRGYLFGDGIYEVIPAYGGAPFRWKEHLNRLNNNLASVDISQPLSDDVWEGILTELTAPSPDTEGADQLIYVQVTRGVAPRDHAFPADASPTVFAYTSVLRSPPRAVVERGLRVVTTEDIRWHRCDLKTTSLIANVWLRQLAVKQKKDESILIRDGIVTEGAVTNVFIVIDDTVYTAPKGPDLLPGITRDLMLELFVDNGIPHVEQGFSREALMQADELWLTSSTKEVVPVVEVDGVPVGSGQPGKLFWRVYELFQQYKEQWRSGL